MFLLFNHIVLYFKLQLIKLFIKLLEKYFSLEVFTIYCFVLV